MKSESLFEWAPHLSTRGHKYNVTNYTGKGQVQVLDIFSERVVNVWNSL